MSRFGDTNTLGQQFRVQLNLQISDGCYQNATYESVRQLLLANFSNLPYLQHFHGFGMQLGIWTQNWIVESQVQANGCVTRFAGPSCWLAKNAWN